MRTVLWLTLATASRKADRNFVLPFEGISRCSFFASGGAAPSSSRHIATPASRRITVREERLVPDICNNPSRQVASLAGPLGAQKSHPFWLPITIFSATTPLSRRTSRATSSPAFFLPTSPLSSSALPTL